MRFLNSKERKLLHRKLEDQYGYTGRLPGVIALHEKKRKLYLMTEEVALFPADGLNVEALGLYVGAYFDGQVRLSIEGAQLLGPECSKRVVTLSHGQMQEFLQGNPIGDVETDAEHGDFVIVRTEDDVIGAGKMSDGEMRNYIPKTRYVHALY